MKYSLLIILTIAVSCAPRIMELGNGKMVTERRWNRMVNREITDRQVERLARRSDRHFKHYWNRLSPEDREWLGNVRLEVVYDSLGREW